jgi:hypothetical protein
VNAVKGQEPQIELLLQPDAVHADGAGAAG